MALYVRLIDRFNKLLQLLLGFMIIVMTLAIFSQVFSRFVLSMPLHWSEELARYLMAYIVFLASPIALRRGRLIAVGVIIEKLNFNQRRVLSIIIQLLIIGFSALLIVKGIEMIESISYQLSPALQIPMSVPYACIPIGALFLILNSVAIIFDLLLQKEVKE